MATLEYRILGPLEVRRDGELVAIPAPKQRALLGLLLLHANEAVPPDELIDELWGEDAPRTARASLQNQVHALRNRLGAEALEWRSGGYLLRVEPGELDLERFERLVAEARRGTAREKASKLRAALALWRGPLLVEFPSQPFVQYEIMRLEEERLIALEDRVDVDLELGQHNELIPELESLADRHPLRERIWGQLMVALYRAGRQADALGTYRRAHRTFMDELGVEPGVDLRELQRAMLVQDPALDDPGRRFGSVIERAAAILPRSPSDRAETLYEYAVSSLRLGEWRQAASMLDAAERLGATVGDRSVEERAHLYRSYLSIWTEGRSPLEHLAEAERAAVRFQERHDDAGLAVALRHQAQMLTWSGRASQGLAAATAAVDSAARLGSEMEASFRVLLPGLLATGPMPVEQAIVRCMEQLTIGARDEPRQRLAVLNALVVLESEAGRIGNARALGGEAIDVARTAGLLMHLIDATFACGIAEYVVGEYAAAIVHLRAAHEILETEADHALLPDLSGQLACALALTGDWAEARRLALDARVRTTPDLFRTEVLWRRALAHVAAHDGHEDEAVRLAHEARTRTAASDWLRFHGETLEEVAIVYRRVNDSVGARGALQEALSAYGRRGNVAGAKRVRDSIEALD